jgi:hypothetical protein
MNFEEYEEKIIKLKEVYEYKKRLISKEYAFSNSTVKVGDILKDHKEIIIVELIGWGFSLNASRPECIYKGPRLKVDLTERKDGRRGVIYQSSVREIK